MLTLLFLCYTQVAGAFNVLLYSSADLFPEEIQEGQFRLKFPDGLIVKHFDSDHNYFGELDVKTIQGSPILAVLLGVTASVESELVVVYDSNHSKDIDAKLQTFFKNASKIPSLTTNHPDDRKSVYPILTYLSQASIRKEYLVAITTHNFEIVDMRVADKAYVIDKDDEWSFLYEDYQFTFRCFDPVEEINGDDCFKKNDNDYIFRGNSNSYLGNVRMPNTAAGEEMRVYLFNLDGTSVAENVIGSFADTLRVFAKINSPQKLPAPSHTRTYHGKKQISVSNHDDSLSALKQTRFADLYKVLLGYRYYRKQAPFFFAVFDGTNFVFNSETQPEIRLGTSGSVVSIRDDHLFFEVPEGHVVDMPGALLESKGNETTKKYTLSIKPAVKTPPPPLKGIISSRQDKWIIIYEGNMQRLDCMSVAALFSLKNSLDEKTLGQMTRDYKKVIAALKN